MEVIAFDVSPDEVMNAAEKLEAALGEVMSGKRAPGNMPVEPMVRLIAFARSVLDKKGEFAA
jgi:hypothetical protein